AAAPVCPAVVAPALGHPPAVEPAAAARERGAAVAHALGQDEEEHDDDDAADAAAGLHPAGDRDARAAAPAQTAATPAAPSRVAHPSGVETGLRVEAHAGASGFVAGV